MRTLAPTTFPAPHSRVPRLSVRNRSPQLLDLSVGPDCIQDDAAAAHSHLLPQSLVLSDKPADSVVPKMQKRRPGHAVFNFFTLREPSSSALEVYAKQQRRLAAEKRGRTEAAAALGIRSGSLQKMPAGVPKVTSKWTRLA